MLELEEPVPAEGSHHPPDGMLKDLTDRASWKMTELVPYQLCAVFVESPVEEDNVQVRIEPQVAGRALHNRYGAGLGRSARASTRSALFVEPLHAPDEDARQRAPRPGQACGATADGWKASRSSVSSLRSVTQCASRSSASWCKPALTERGTDVGFVPDARCDLESQRDVDGRLATKRKELW